MRADPPYPPSPDERPVAAIFRSPIFNASETFIQAHALSLQRYQPLVVGLEDKGNVALALRDRILLAASVPERLRFRFGWVGAMARRMRPYSPALIHAHFGPDGLAALPLARTLGVPLVTTLHGYEVSRSDARMLTSGRPSWMRYALGKRVLMREGALFVAVSKALRSRAVARGYPPERTITHHNGVDLRRFAAESVPEDGFILHVGRLVEKKGTSPLIDAFAQVSAAWPGARLEIAGDGPLRLRLEAQAAGLGLGDCVRFLGRLSPEAVAERMARAWLLAVPSLTARDGDAEGLPTTIFEAAAAALPVVASDHSGIPEAVIDGETGFIVPEGEAEPLAARMLDLLRSPDLRASMGRAARALAEERFDAVRQAKVLEAHYDRLVKAEPPCG